MFIPEKNTAALSHNIEDYPDGIVLVVDKPYRWTSADVIRKVKWLACRHFGKKNLKVGHAGTLDPLATGVLLVCIGNATKKAEQLQAHDKEYIAGVSFGATTPSYDLEKDIDRRFPVDGVTEEAVRKALEGFLGEQEQVAPLFSAKSVDGVRAYEIARKLYRKAQQGRPDGSCSGQNILNDSGENASTDAQGSTFDSQAEQLIRTARIRIDRADLLAFSPEGTAKFAPKTEPDYSGLSPEEIERAREKDSRINIVDISSLHLPLAEIRLECTKGTYVRAFARDLGESLGGGAFLSYLTRSRSGDFGLSESLSLNDIARLFA